VVVKVCAGRAEDAIVSDVTAIDTDDRRVVRRAVVNASPSEIFALVADPHRHHEIDGSGTVRDKIVRPHQLEVGSRFSVGMKQAGLPYTITSTVTAYEPDHLVEWRHPAGHRWRWEFEQVGPNSTQITETWDPTGTPLPLWLFFRVSGMPRKNTQGITNTLAGLQKRFA
jgi:hypothetical protein